MEIIVNGYGPLPPGAVGYARKRLRLVGTRAGSRATSVRVRLVQLVGSAVERPAFAHGSVAMRGRRIDARAAGTTMFEAVDRLQERLMRQVDRELHRREELRRPNSVGRVGRSAFGRMTVDEAVASLAAPEHAFALFVDTATGEDCLVYRDGEDGIGVCRAGSAPVLSAADAAGLLDGQRFVFFVDAETRRGVVVYRARSGQVRTVARG